MSKMTPKAKDLFDSAVGLLQRGKVTEAKDKFDDFQIEAPGTWEGVFYHFYASALDRLDDLKGALTLGDKKKCYAELMSVVQPMQKRAQKIVDLIHETTSTNEECCKTISVVVKMTTEFYEKFDTLMGKIHLKASQNVRKGLHEAEKEFSDGIYSFGYALGDALMTLSEKDGDYYKNTTITLWQKCLKDHSVRDEFSKLRKEYIRKIKILAPNIKVGGEVRRILRWIMAICILIPIGMFAWEQCGVGYAVKDFFSSLFTKEPDANEAVHLFDKANTGVFKLTGEVTGWDDKWFKDDEIYLRVPSTDLVINVTCLVEDLPTLKKGQLLTVKGEKIKYGTMKVRNCTTPPPSYRLPVYGESASVSPISTSAVASPEPVVKDAAITAENNTTQPASAPTENPASSTEANSQGQNKIEEEIEKSMNTFRSYVAEMNDTTHDKDWHSKYQGTTLTLTATMKKVKVKKSETIIECKVNGENVVVTLADGQESKAQSLSKGETFIIRGSVARKRFGILHTMGLSNGEIVDKN